MQRCLIVANQTLGGLALVSAIRERLAAGPALRNVLAGCLEHPPATSDLTVTSTARRGLNEPVLHTEHDEDYRVTVEALGPRS